MKLFEAICVPVPGLQENLDKWHPYTFVDINASMRNLAIS